MRRDGAVYELFPNHVVFIHRLREADAGFHELCEDLDTLHKEMVQKFGSVDQAATDLISSFDDVRREIERHLTLRSGHQT